MTTSHFQGTFFLIELNVVKIEKFCSSRRSRNQRWRSNIKTPEEVRALVLEKKIYPCKILFKVYYLISMFCVSYLLQCFILKK